MESGGIPQPSGPGAPPELCWPGKRLPPLAPPRLLRCTDILPAAGAPGGPANRLLMGDNLPLMEALLPELRGRVDLVYLDPPYATGSRYTATLPVGDAGTPDRGAAAAAYADPDDPGPYLQALYERLLLVRELLSESGSLLLHVDWRAAHHAQCLLDELFGRGERAAPGQPGFRNEIVWGYGGGGAPRRAYPRKHDNLLWYSKGATWTFHPQRRPYTAKTLERGLTAVKGPRYMLHPEGAVLTSWWTDPGVQKILSPTAYENLKYPTQKPEALLERLLRGHSSPGDLVADFYCGCGTTGAVAERLGRRWLLADAGPLAAHLTWKRLAALRETRASAGESAAPLERWEPAGCPEAPAGGELSAEVELLPGGAAAVRLREFVPALPEGASPALRERAAADGMAFLDYWAVDFPTAPGAPGAPFRHRWWSARLPGNRSLAHRSEPLAVPPGAAAVEVLAADVWGRVTQILLPLPP